MSVFDQRRMIHGLRRAGVLTEDEELDARSLMTAIGSVAERAYLPVQGRSDRDDLRLANEDIATMSQQQQWIELKRAEFVATWADVRDQWVFDRIKALNKAMRAR